MAKITLSDGMVIEGTIEEFKQMGLKFPVEDEEANDEYRKVTGRAPKVGDFVKYSYSPYVFIKVGKYYEIEEIDDGELFHIDEDGDSVAPDSDESFEVYEKLAPCCEPTPEPLKVGDYAKVIDIGGPMNFTNIGDIIKIDDVRLGSKRVTYTVLRNGRQGSVVNYEFEKATDEEVAEANAQFAEKEVEAKWAKIGRKPSEYKKGDIVSGVRWNDSAVVFIGYLEDEPTDGYVGVREHNGRFSAVRIEDAALITPVEARFDRANA
jgi:hypothetical protein